MRQGRHLLRVILAGILGSLLVAAIPPGAPAQETPDGAAAVPAAPGQTSAALAADQPTGEVPEKGINFLLLLRRGGWFMIPLGLLSVLVVAVGIERLLALREERMMPRKLVTELGQLCRYETGFDPRLAYRVCQLYPSVAARVIKSMLLKVGRPQLEVEQAVSEASQREASRLQTVVSWLTLAAAVAPLIGLLGTVWGMIQAFYDTTQLVAGQNKAEALAQGIYTALVTTMCGLSIAIPAAVMAHFFENRIIYWFHRIEELAGSLTPQLEQFEGRIRTSYDGKKRTAEEAVEGAEDIADPGTSQPVDKLPR